MTAGPHWSFGDRSFKIPLGTFLKRGYNRAARVLVGPGSVIYTGLLGGFHVRQPRRSDQGRRAQ
ncbi:hypothetical protein SBA4_4970004 [Candidatus Sulfopaludibacter sp. SbA4]|nr:hypothetical protein SBA4_4970004 [Candidatus Sulfopaludibacter sp. SbA4]